MKNMDGFADSAGVARSVQTVMVARDEKRGNSEGAEQADGLMQPESPWSRSHPRPPRRRPLPEASTIARAISRFRCRSLNARILIGPISTISHSSQKPFFVGLDPVHYPGGGEISSTETMFLLTLWMPPSAQNGGKHFLHRREVNAGDSRCRSHHLDLSERADAFRGHLGIGGRNNDDWHPIFPGAHEALHLIRRLLLGMDQFLSALASSSTGARLRAWCLTRAPRSAPHRARSPTSRDPFASGTPLRSCPGGLDPQQVLTAIGDKAPGVRKRLVLDHDR